MDIISAILGLGGTTLFILAIVMGLIGWNQISLGFKKNSLKFFKVGAVGFAIAGAVASGWLVTDTQTAVTPAGEAEWDSTATEAMSHVISVNTNHFKVQMAFNDTSDAFTGQTQYCQLNFTVDRLDTNTDFAFTTAEVTEIGEYTSTNTGFDYYIVQKGTDGLFDADFTKSNSGTANMVASLPVDRDSRSDYVVLNMTASATCVAQMSQYHSVTTTIIVGGEAFYVEWEKTTVST